MTMLRWGAMVAGGALLVGGGYAALYRGNGDAASSSTSTSAASVAASVDAMRAPPRLSPAVLPAPQDIESLNTWYDGKVHFVRIMYTPAGRGRFGGRRGGREPVWAHDYPRGERNFMKIIGEMTDIDALVDGSNILTLDDPRLFQYPIAYIVEVGSWEPTDAEVEGLSQYLQKGGFLIVDDFRDEFSYGTPNLSSFMLQMGRGLPGIQFVELDETHEIFDSFFRIDPHQVIPPYGPQTPVWYGLFEDNDPEKRLMVIVNYDNDISEYWEFSDMGFYPIDLSNEAYKLGVNYLVYALTH